MFLVFLQVQSTKFHLMKLKFLHFVQAIANQYGLVQLQEELENFQQAPLPFSHFCGFNRVIVQFQLYLSAHWF